VRTVAVTMADRILIVDDDPASILLLTAVLREIGAEVCGVSESSEALRAFHRFEPDLVILDLHMPAPDGIEILRALRLPRAFAGYLPVVVLTADTGTDARDTALDLGANDFLTKPLDRTEIVVRVRNLLLTRLLYRHLAGSPPRPGSSEQRGPA
jgi:putative two-component system response regulator